MPTVWTGSPCPKTPEGVKAVGCETQVNQETTLLCIRFVHLSPCCGLNFLLFVLLSTVVFLRSSRSPHRSISLCIGYNPYETTSQR